MSVATELPPVVFIPERARTVPRPQLRVVAGASVTATTAVLPSRLAKPRIRPHEVEIRSPQSVRVSRPAQAGVSTLRLTRRGVVALWVTTGIVAGLMLAVAYLSWRPSDAGASQARPVGTVRVEPGDTLWSIAGRIAPGRDPRNVVADLRDLNHLTGASLVPGQVLTVG